MGDVVPSLPRVLVVNNYPSPDRFQRVTEALAAQGARISTMDWSEASAKKFDLYDGVVLSGSPAMLTDPDTISRFRAELDAILQTKAPLLGICFGHQMMATAFGSKVVKDREPVRRNVETTVLTPGGIFDGLPTKMMLAESRHEVVRSLPGGFELLARSETSPIAAMRHRERLLFGLQSHPERYSQENPEGAKIISNFLALLK